MGSIDGVDDSLIANTSYDWFTGIKPSYEC